MQTPQDPVPDPVSRVTDAVTPEDGTLIVSHPSQLTEDYVPAASPTVHGQIGDYAILGEIARGGMGVVYKARHTKLKRIAAVKLIKSGELADEDQIRRFQAEAQAAARLDHPGIVPIYEVGSDGQQHYLAMAYIDGPSLKQRLKESPMEPRLAAHIMQQVAEAIQYAHSQGIIHRDLKPQNILLTKQDEPKVTDFGLAKNQADDSGLTSTGAVLGTPSFMSPEQANGRIDQVGPLADVYSLGATLYCLLTGRPPFQAANALETLFQVTLQEPVSPRDLNRSVPQDLETICLKCLEKLPARRYASAAALADDLRRFQNGIPIQARPVSGVEHAWRWCQRNRVVASLIATAASLLVAVAVVSTVSAFWLKAFADSERQETIRANKETKKAIELAGLNATLANREKAARLDADQSAADARRQTKLARRNLLVSNMNLVQSNWENARIGAVRNLLDRWRPALPSADQGSNHTSMTSGDPPLEDLRGFEWYYWDRLSQSFLLKLAGDGASIALSSDGRFLVSASGNVKVWDAVHGNEVRTLPWITKGNQGWQYLQSQLSQVAISADGGLIAGSSSDGTVIVWTASGQQVFKIEGATRNDVGQVAFAPSLAFSPDGKMLASVRYGGTILVWDITSRKEVLSLKPPQLVSVYSVAFSNDGKQLAAMQGTALRTWDASTGQELLQLKGMTGTVATVAFSADGKQVGGAAFDGKVMVWDAVSGEELHSWKGQVNQVSCAAFSPDFRRVAMSSYADRTVTMWNVDHGTEVCSLIGHASGVRGLSFSPDGAKLAACGDGDSIKFWDAVAGQEPLTVKSRKYNIVSRNSNSVVFDRAGRNLAIAGQDRTVKIFDATTGSEQRSISGHTGAILCVAYGPDGKTLASGGGYFDNMDNTVRVWDSASGDELLILRGHTAAVTCVAFGDNGTLLASGGGLGDHTVRIWDGMRGRELFTLRGHTGMVNGVAFSPDGKRLASAGGPGDSTVKVWDTATGQDLMTFKGHSNRVNCVAFDSTGQRVASAGADQTVKVWDPVTGAVSLTLTGHTQEVTSITFSPNGDRLATGSEDKTVKVWDTTTGEETLTLKGHVEEVRGVAFSPDGLRLAAVGNDYSVKVWDARPWTPALNEERQAVSLVSGLCTQEWSPKVVLDRIAAAAVSEPIRNRAGEFVGPYNDALDRQADELVQSLRSGTRFKLNVVTGIRLNPFISEAVRIRAAQLAAKLPDNFPDAEPKPASVRRLSKNPRSLESMFPASRLTLLKSHRFDRSIPFSKLNESYEIDGVFAIRSNEGRWAWNVDGLSANQMIRTRLRVRNSPVGMAGICLTQQGDQRGVAVWITGDNRVVVTPSIFAKEKPLGFRREYIMPAVVHPVESWNEFALALGAEVLDIFVNDIHVDSVGLKSHPITPATMSFAIQGTIPDTIVEMGDYSVFEIK